MYNREFSGKVMAVSPYSYDINEDHIIGVVLTIDTETKDINSILDLGFGDFRDTMEKFLKLTALPIDSYKLRIEHRTGSRLYENHTGRATGMRCEVTGAEIKQHTDKTGNIALRLKVKIDDIDDDTAGKLVAMLKEDVMFQIENEQEELPLNKPKGEDK